MAKMYTMTGKTQIESKPKKLVKVMANIANMPLLLVMEHLKEVEDKENK